MKAQLQAKLTATVQQHFRTIEELLMSHGYATLPRPLQRACNGAAMLRQELDPPKLLTTSDCFNPPSAIPPKIRGRRHAQEARLSRIAHRISRKRSRKKRGNGYFD